jgi:mono/diheme cytochrome c family protein
VLGFSALQLSPDRDPLAPHAEAPEPGSVDLPALARRGLVSDLPAALLARPPRVEAPTPVGRAAQGYLHGNCASCHDVRGDLASLGLDLTQRVEPSPGAGPLASAVGVRSRYRPSGASGPAARIAAGEPDASALVARISTRFPAAQMPPAGTHLVDEEAVRLVRAWIEELDPTRSNGPRRVARSAPPARTE